MSSSFVTVYGGIRTTTFTTTVTAFDLSSTAALALSWPSLATTQPIEYTSVASPTDLAPKIFPGSLPIFVATEVDGVVVDTAGQPLATLVQVQAQPAYVYDVDHGGTGTDCNGWTCWSAGKKAGIIVGAVLGGVLFILFSIWFCCFLPVPRSWVSSTRDEEQGYGKRTRGMGQRRDSGKTHRRKRVRNSDPDSGGRHGRKRVKRRHRSLSSGYVPGPPRPLPRIVTSQEYREIRRVASVPEHILHSETSSGSTGRRAVIGVRGREYPRGRTTARAVTTQRATPRVGSNLDMPEHGMGRESRYYAKDGQRQRGRSPVRKRPSRNPSPRRRSYSPHRRQLPNPKKRSISPSAANHSSKLAPYIPVAVAALEHIWDRIEEGSNQNGQRQSQDHSLDHEARRQRRSLRGERRASRQHSDGTPFSQAQSGRNEEQEVAMSGGRGESPAGPPALI